MRHALLAAALICPGLAAAQTVQVFDLPGSATTCGTAIASDGLVAGLATFGGAKQATPFLWQAGRFAFPLIPLPAGVAYYQGVNRARTIVGFVLTSASLGVAPFERHGGTVSLPDAGDVVSVDAVANSGATLGQRLVGGGLSQRTAGFILHHDGSVTSVDDGSFSVQPRGMDATGKRAVGNSVGEAGYTAWSFRGGAFTPMAFPGAATTMPAAIDMAGRVAGTYLVGQGSATTAHGFFLQDGAYAAWNVPGSSATQIEGANEAGQFTGCFTNAQGVHGFFASP